MELSIVQIIVLSIIQAITEFLPISSSAHLLLPSKVLGWPDQGIIFDITVHFATLMAVLTYFRDEFLRLSFYVSRTFKFLVISTLPIVLIALFMPGMGDYRWSLTTIAYANIFFAFLLYISEKTSQQKYLNSDMTAKDAIVIGLFQTFSLISGASRSGTAITGSLFLGFKKSEAAKYSLMLSIPTILGALIFGFIEINTLKEDINILTTFIAFLTTYIVSYLSISLFLGLVKKLGYMPFIVYRLFLGILLLWLI
ncbi:MAG: undecaprenyl-diphosphate phosphatase [Gammaproteobacteria bacterium TMED112]|nr:MAG: undecaprenyl-diphosphate phosphatase [Gammaproteobacteria bacterium TMED112]|tara:strand:+ start:5853 stop:6614 length:762 start_codon:yes stop_codon:yes gene_type:complete